MKFLNILPLISLVAAASNDTTPAVPVEVKIEQVGATAFKATVQSHHTADLKLLKTGSILDESAVEKATVLSGGKSKLIYKSIEGLNKLTVKQKM